MFAKIVISFLLVSVFPCRSQRRQLVEVPFADTTSNSPRFGSRVVFTQVDADNSGQPTAQSPIPISTTDNQAFNQHLLQTNQFGRNHHINSEPRSRQQSFQASEFDNPSFGHFQESAGHRQRTQSFRTSQGRTSHRRRPTTPAPPVTTNTFHPSLFGVTQPTPTFDFQQNFAHQQTQNRFGDAVTPTVSQISETPSHSLFTPAADNQFLNSVPQTTGQPRRTHTFINVEEPVLRRIDPEPHRFAPVQPTQPPRRAHTFADINQHAFINDMVFPARFVQSENIPNPGEFLASLQPAVRAPVTPPQPQASFNFESLQNNEQPRQTVQFPQQQPFTINVQPEPLPRRQEHHRASVVSHIPRGQKDSEDEESIFRKQAESAKYSFASQIDDTISDNQHQREEVRDGLAVKGKYSYSDGYVKRTVHYEADEKGYRVVKEEEEPLGDGPQVDPNGQANVATYVSGNALKYSITAADIQEPEPNTSISPLSSRRG